MLVSSTSQLGICLQLTRAISRSRTVEEIYESALDALGDGLAVSRASILLFDPDGVMRFKAHRRLSDGYRRAVEGHTPWQPDTLDAVPIVVGDVTADPSLAPYLDTIRGEGIAAMAFIPLVSLGRVIGKFMLYYDAPRALSLDELQLAGVIASQVGFAVERTRAEESARRSEERLRFALDAALTGTWDWDLRTGRVVWSPQLEALHGLPAGTFDGSFASYEREIHPEDRARVLESVQRALADGRPHDVEYRIVSPDGTIRWVEGKGRVEYEGGRPVRMTGVCMVITRRKEAELARLAAAEEASRVKDQFLATLSHELRTPLDAIVGWVQMVESGDYPASWVPHAVDVIGRNARLLARLIEDILDVSRIISGKFSVERRPVLMSQLIEAAAAAALPLAAAKQVTLRNEVPAELPPIEGDPRRLQQVLGNVLSNAIKFTPEGGQVRLCSRVSERRLMLEIIDTGIGIEADFLPYVFERFRQGDSGITRAHGGLGLGLAIARHLVEQHGGSMTAASGGRGAGTTIAIELPLPVAASPLLGNERGEEGAALPGLQGRTAVIVDDHDDAREIVAALLERCGALTVSCPDAESALEALARTEAPILVADIAMPQVDGLELISRVRQRFGAVPAIAVSACARAEDEAAAIAVGFDGFCAKPLDARALYAMLSRVIG
jgi:PAS domain S-box-containing protein